jgi:hypothetical protein
MTLWRTRWLLWAVAVVAPGGVLLVPLLAADAVRRRSTRPASNDVPLTEAGALSARLAR